MAMTEDLSVFFSATEFADTVILAGVAVQGIFDNGFALGDVGKFGMASTQPSWTLPTASLPPRIIDWFRYFEEPFDPLDLLITVQGTQYKISAHEPDGSGVSRLLLETA